MRICDKCHDLVMENDRSHKCKPGYIRENDAIITRGEGIDLVARLAGMPPNPYTKEFKEELIKEWKEMHSGE